MRLATKVIHAGLQNREQGAAFDRGVQFAGTYYTSGDPSSSPYTYGRYHNPTWTEFERALGELEGGAAVAFASGMAAVAAVFGTVLSRGETVVVPSDCYYTTRLLADGFFSSVGVQVRKTPTGSNISQHLDGAKLLWLETPSNPGLDVFDIAALATEAKERGILVAVDNTTATVLGQNPLSLGADFSVSSDSKSLTGHSDLILGHVAVDRTDLADRLLSWRSQMGSIPGPMEAWLGHRSLLTLELRLERQCRNALSIARYLAAHSKTKRVRYPGLEDDPSHAIASRQMRYFGPVVSFVLDSKENAERFLNTCQLVIEATSFGGLHTTAERRARWGGDAIPDGFIRLSVGCEDIEDLIADIDQALETL